MCVANALTVSHLYKLLGKLVLHSKLILLLHGYFTKRLVHVYNSHGGASHHNHLYSLNRFIYLHYPYSRQYTHTPLFLNVVNITFFAVAEVGVCYGRLGSNLPCPEDVVALYKQNGIKRMRIYDPYKPTLEALCGSGIELMLGIPEADLPDLAKHQSHADEWVQVTWNC